MPVTFGTAYPNADYAVIVTGVTHTSGTTYGIQASVTSKTSTGFTVFLSGGGTSGTTESFYWMTVPYSNP
jgi:hypothetical protein